MSKTPSTDLILHAMRLASEVFPTLLNILGRTLVLSEMSLFSYCTSLYTWLQPSSVASVLGYTH